MTAYRVTDLPERIAIKIYVNPETGCWEWTGSRDRHGYGTVKWAGRPQKIHRVTFTLLAGAIPDGLQIDHVHANGCRSKACCWPAHLEPVTGAENMRRAGRLITHCPAGHEYTPNNTYTPPGSGSRFCVACKRGDRPQWVRVLTCPACGNSRTGPPGRYCGDCRCVAVNAHGKRCGNMADGFLCGHHAKQPLPATAQVESYARVAVDGGPRLSLDVGPGQKIEGDGSGGATW